ncbi:alpha/beta fold hydrolase [Mycolicibacterium sp. 120266]|jgi:pimeloyl-ACP methyl ester carboxylesterase|uniref:alpha/beta fold hydrolase n=1 Tax=Mycolicibacterium sp. 120266 TaxID=3090601 RepID=UPI00299EA023|nr:alpha/beta fold hydrolase [Mycolicibacterium sp. 120266]MDX1875171.1 alpha/beta fold hydrolase [Mycolicibacterium sp. 120266]
MADPRVLEFDLPHLRLTALEWGPSDGRVALCVHGFPDSAHSWRHVAPMLADNGFRVIAPFTRGYAPTGPAPDGDYHLGALMSDLVELHAALGAPADAVLIGHDWGGWTANALAASPDSPFAAHISLALPPIRAIAKASLRLTRTVTMGARQLRMSWYILFFQTPLVPERVLDRVIPRLWKDWSPPGTDVDDDAARTLTALPSAAHRRAAVGYYRANMRFTPASKPYKQLHRYRLRLPRVPVLLLHGDTDGCMQAGYLDGAQDLLPPGSKIQIIAGAGHFLQIDQPEAVTAAILQYLG